MKVTYEFDNIIDYNKFAKEVLKFEANNNPTFPIYHEITRDYLRVLGLYDISNKKQFDLYVNGYIEERGLYMNQLINRILNIGWNKEGVLLASMEDNSSLYLFTN